MTRRFAWRAARGLVSCLLVVAAAGCSFERPESAIPTRYDFGPSPAHSKSNPVIPGTVLIAQVRAPAWLDDTGIVYRLLYEDPTVTHLYGMSKWAAEPASLMTDRLRSRFAVIAAGVIAPGFGARSDYTLRVELEDFSQHFRSPSESRVLLRARATLLSTEGRKVLAQRIFNVEKPAGANAPGAVKALTEANDAFIEELAKWAVENAK